MSAAKQEVLLEAAGQVDSSFSASPAGELSNHVADESNFASVSDPQQLASKLAELEMKISTMTTKFEELNPSDLGAKNPFRLLGTPENRLQEASTARNEQNQRQENGIRYRMREYNDKGDSFSEHDYIIEETQDEDNSRPYWLKFIDARRRNGDPLPDKCEFVICDTELRDFISTAVIPAYVEHTGKTAWQKKETILKPNFITIVLNYIQLKNAADDGSAYDASEKTRQRLANLLEMIRGKSDEQLFRHIDNTTFRDFRILYRFCWRLFRPGTLIVSQWNRAGDLQVFKVHNFTTNSDYSSISAWMWDWDGEELQRTLFEFRIMKYDDEKYPAELTCYPIEFCEILNDEEAKKSREMTGRKRKESFYKYTYAQLVNREVLHCTGEIICGSPDVSYDTLFQRSVLRASDILDFKRNYTKRVKVHKVDEDIVLDTMNFVRRNGGSRWLGVVEPSSAKLCHCSLCLDHETQNWTEALKRDKQFASSTNDLLLPPRLLGYSLGRKEWCQFSLECIGGSKDRENLDHKKGLILPDGLEDEEQNDIYHMVAHHSQVMAKPLEERIGDVIGGKGESLILLFHGTSGTGKTLYAEWLAKCTERPLFKVGTSELGLDAAVAERNLKEIFELAETWGAVLLIDEADVLLDARGGPNESLLSKNALVSVLLREVEYYKGILIMTTNRVKAFDPAILSRIHHAVNFEETTQAQEKKIWEAWISRIEARNLSGDVSKLRKWVMNVTKNKSRVILSGREIRNVFIQAQTIAAVKGKVIDIGAAELERAYEYRQTFRRDTNEQRIESNTMQARRAKNQG